MARLTDLRGTTAYLDTNLFIYAVEGYEREEAFVRALFAALERGEFAAVTSELTLAEVLVRPFALGRMDVVATYIDLLRPSDRLAVVPVDRAILVEAARQRAALGIRPMRSMWRRRWPPGAVCSSPTTAGSSFRPASARSCCSRLCQLSHQPGVGSSAGATW